MVEDKRIKATRNRIIKSFAQCLSDCSLEKVTVKKICDVAEINRSTFYDHYNDIYDLYDSVKRDVESYYEKSLRSLNQGDMTYRRFLIQVLEYIRSNKDVILALMKNEPEYIEEMICSCLKKQGFFNKNPEEDNNFF